MANRLTMLLTSPDLRISLGRAARLKIEREYDKKSRVPELERLYDRARAIYGN
jgi:hypothetical protein